MMPTIDWSKPIEVYEYITNETVADAEMVVADLKGSHPYAIRYVRRDEPNTEYVMACSASGVIRCNTLRVRNKPVVRRQYLAVGVRSGGGVYSRPFPTKEEAEKFLVTDAVELKRNYVTTQVVELEWTEE